MDFFVQGIKQLIAVISGVTLLVFPASSPHPLPSPAPITQHTVTAPSSLPDNVDTITIVGEQTYLGKGVGYTLNFPRSGGEAKGSFSGLCSGNLQGSYSGDAGQNNLHVNAAGECNIVFIKQSINANFSGKAFPKEGKLEGDWEGKIPFMINKGSISLSFTPQ